MKFTPKLVGQPKEYKVDEQGYIKDFGNLTRIFEGTAKLTGRAIPGEEEVKVDREAEVLLLYPADEEPVGCIVFGHGFSQHPGNYASTLRTLAGNGYLIIAPTTDVFQTAWPWICIEEVGRFEPMDVKLQTALAHDMLRSVLYLKDECIDAPHQNLAILGHSMGGGLAVLVASTLESAKVPVKTVAALAPLRPNPAVVTKELEDLALNLDCSLHMVSAVDDSIVPTKEVSDSFNSITSVKNIRKVIESSDAKQFVPTDTLFSVFVAGNHIGYEDSLGFRFVTPTRLCVPWAKNWSEQKERTKSLLLDWFRVYLKGESTRRNQLFDPKQQQLTVRFLLSDEVEKLIGSKVSMA